MSESPFAFAVHLPNAVVVHVMAEELGKAQVDAICATIDEARVTAPALSFILDMAKVKYAPSMGLGVIVGLTKEFRNRGQRLILVALQPTMRDAFKITHLDRTLEIMADVPTAHTSLTPVA